MTPLATVRFSVRDPVGKNATYKRGVGRRLYISSEAKAFRERLAAAAAWAFMLSKKPCAWPTDPLQVTSVRVTAQLFDTSHDADAVTAIVRDTLQGLLYDNDRCVSNGANEPPIQDGKGRRVEVVAELLAVRTPQEAATIRARKEKAALRRLTSTTRNSASRNTRAGKAATR